MEPLSARGLPRLSWIDTLYSSMYPSILLFTHLHTSLPIYLCACLYLQPFYPSTPLSPSHGLPLRVTTRAVSSQRTLCIFSGLPLCASLWLSITRCSPLNTHTHTLFSSPLPHSGNSSCLPELFVGFQAHNQGKAWRNLMWVSESCLQPGGRTLCSNLSRTQAV